MNPPSEQRFDLRDIPPVPWKNGAGLTREIASHPPGAGADGFAWRISVAEVDRDAPFSAFPGVDRCIAPLRGAGLRLRSVAGGFDHRLDGAAAAFRFPGEVDIDARLLDGPCSDFNVMVRRGVFEAEVERHAAACEWPAEAPTLLLCGAGEWRIEVASAPAFRVGARQGVWWREPAPPVRATPQGAALLLSVRLRRRACA